MKRVVPTIVAILAGFIVLLGFFLQNRLLEVMGKTIVDWAVILASLALILGVINLIRVHFTRIRHRERKWPYSIILVLALWVVLVIGLLDPAGPGTGMVSWVFNHIQFPLQAAFFSLLAFFILTAAYRAFRVKKWESLLFVLAGLLVLVGATFLGSSVWEGFAEARAWIMEVPAMAGARGILIGVALGTVLTGLRLLLGFDRPYAE